MSARIPHLVAPASSNHHIRAHTLPPPSSRATRGIPLSIFYLNFLRSAAFGAAASCNEASLFSLLTSLPIFLTGYTKTSPPPRSSTPHSSRPASRAHTHTASTHPPPPLAALSARKSLSLRRHALSHPP